MKKFISLFAVGSMLFSLVLVNGAWADSTIGTNISTTGTLTVNNSSGTAIQFQNGSGTNVFIFDTSNRRLGIRGTPGTTFEVQGTASASYFLTGNTIQVGGYASVAYSRFGTNTTTYSNDITTTNDLLISGNLEVDLKSYFDAPGEFQGTASASYFLTGNTLQVGGYASVAYSRFGTGATGHGLSANNDLLITGFAEFDKRAYFDATASAAYFFSQNAAQFAGNASVAYSRFGTTTTNHANYISAANDLLVSGDAELRGSVSFGGVASVSGLFFMNDGRFRPNANSATAFRFQNTAGTTNVLTIDTTNTRVGVNAGGDVDTTFEVGGTSSISGLALFGGSASVSDRFELTSTTGRLGINAGAFTDTAFEVGGVASVGTNLNVGENSAATTSVTFETRSTTQGACFILTGSNNTVYYARIVASGASGVEPKWRITTVNCNQ